MTMLVVRSVFSYCSGVRLALCIVVVLSCCLASAPLLAQTISYVQGNYATPQSSQSSVAIQFNTTQTGGDLNVVVVGWNDSSATVSTVTDKAGNPYIRAVGPTVVNGFATQAIYYAKNIVAASGNAVTVKFSKSAVYADIRILEYTGVDPTNPVDVAVAASGNSTLSSCGPVNTTYPADLLFSANIVQTTTTGPGTGFVSRLLTSPDGDIAEDQLVAVTGGYAATAPLSSAGPWIMQMVAFRSLAAGGGSGPAVSLSSNSLNFGSVPVGTTSGLQAVTLTNVGSAQLTISSIAVGGGNFSDFSESNNCGSALDLNATCSISVMFTPSAAGIRNSSVILTDNAANSPQTISLAGTGGTLSISPHVSVLTLNRTQQFTASAAGASWSVDGIDGGSAAVGTVTTSGLYAPPNGVGTHTVTATLSGQSDSATVYVTNYPGTFTYHNDNLRTGQNTNENVLTPANVNQSQFGKLLSYPLDGITFASPLYVANVSIPGQGSHNIVYVATEHDSVYAFDADGLSSAPVWKVSFLKSGVSTVPCSNTGECGDIPNEIGITSTPVIDPASRTIYVVAKTKEKSKYVQRLHALDIATGAEKFGGPVIIQASVTGHGDGATGGKVTFDPLRENQRAGLLLNNGVVYFGFASHGDQHPWHGWIFGYSASTLQQTMVFNASPDGYGAGIWQAGGGLATDSSGNLFFSTGNGDFNVDSGGRDYGDSILKLGPNGSVVDYFTPYDQGNLESLDLDLASAGPVLLLDLPGTHPHVLIAAAKGGTIYVVDRDNMGHFHSGSDSQIIQSLPGVLPHGNLEQGNYSAPVFFNNTVYFAAVDDYLKAFTLSNGLLSTLPSSQTAVTYPNRGGAFAISANGSSSGILWAVQDNNPDIGVLRAYDAGDLAHELYNSRQAGSRDALDVASKFNIPLVANGMVYIATNGQLTAYGLLP